MASQNRNAQGPAFQVSGPKAPFSLSFLVKSYFHFLLITVVFNLLPKACLHLACLNFEAMRYFHITLRIKCPHFELFWSEFSRIWTEYGETVRPEQLRIRTLFTQLLLLLFNLFKVGQIFNSANIFPI